MRQINSFSYQSGCPQPFGALGNINEMSPFTLKTRSLTRSWNAKKQWSGTWGDKNTNIIANALKSKLSQLFHQIENRRIRDTQGIPKGCTRDTQGMPKGFYSGLYVANGTYPLGIPSGGPLNVSCLPDSHVFQKCLNSRIMVYFRRFLTFQKHVDVFVWHVFKSTRSIHCPFPS